MSAPSDRLPHIQGLRALAVLMVIAYHAGLPLPGGFVGVDVFFVISGYVITAMLARELEREGRVRFARFYLRRFKRLTPALALMVTVTCLLAAFVLSPLGPQQRAAETAIGAVLLAANWVISQSTGGYFDAPAGTNPLLHTWSLSVEEQFYLGFPLLMFLAWAWARRRQRPSHVKAAIAVVALASFALAVVGSRGATSNHFLDGFYSPFTRAWEFALGALLALLPQPRWTRRGHLLIGLFGLLALAASLWLITGSTPFPSAWTLLPVAATLALLSAGRDGSIGAFLSARPMVRIGDWSYSLYLWHWPAIVFATMLWPLQPGVGLLAAAACVLPAVLSFRYLEQPIRTRDFSVRGLIALIAVTVSVPLVVSGGLRLVADHVWKPRVQVASQPASAKAKHAEYLLGCHYEPGDGDRDPKPCRWGEQWSGSPVYLLGDSNAAQFDEALIDATTSLQRELIAATSSGCPLLDLELAGPDFPGYGRACLARNERLLAWLAAAPAGTVVLAASNHYWLDPGWSVQLDGRSVTEPSQRIAAMRASLTRVVRQLQGSGHQVLLVQTIPHWVGAHAWDPSRCTLAATLQGCTHRMTVADAKSATAPVEVALAAVGESTGSTVLDVTPQVCPQGICVTATDAMPVYRDATHITVAMSHALAPVFQEALAR